MRKAKPVTQRVDVPVEAYVVHVTYPGNSKQYAYWCDLPGVRVGSLLQINNAACCVQRITSNSLYATKWVPGSFASVRDERRAAIARRLHEIEKEQMLLERWTKLKSPEAKKLVAELRRLDA
jgi:hypothetical protein